MEREYEALEARDTENRLALRGILALYGGGRQTEREQNRKGHGFWLYRCSQGAIAQYRAAGGYCWIPGQPILNDGTATGNPYFWTVADALRLCTEEVQS